MTGTSSQATRTADQTPDSVRPAPGPLSPERLGLLFGLLGVLAFSLTLPMTRVAVPAFGPAGVGLGRSVVAAALAGVALLLTRQRRPSLAQLKSLAIISAGVIFGFPLLSAWAMVRVPAAHGAVTLGLLPLATAGAGALLAGERPSRAFWLASLVGSGGVLWFALSQGGGRLEPADLALVAAVIAAAVGYAEGGRLARELGGWQVISWALVLAAPLVAVPALLSIDRAQLAAATPAQWGAFVYVAVISQFLGFFAWYRGMALSGVARVGQLQLLQPFFTILGSAGLLGEQITPATWAGAAVVVLAVALGRRAPVRRRA